MFGWSCSALLHDPRNVALYLASRPLNAVSSEGTRDAAPCSGSSRTAPSIAVSSSVSIVSAIASSGNSRRKRPGPVVPQARRAATEDLLELGVVHRPELAVDGLGLAKRLERRAAFRLLAEERSRDADPREVGLGAAKGDGHHRQLVRLPLAERSERLQHRLRVVEVVDQKSAEQEPDGKQTERELGDHAEVPTAAPERPEELRVVAVRGDDRPPVGGHDRRGEQVVERESVEADQVPDPTAEGEPGHARVAERPAGRREAVSLAGRVEVLPECPATARRGARLRIDDDVAHQPQVDHHAALAHAVAGDAVATSADGDRKVALARVRQGGDDVLRCRAGARSAPVGARSSRCT
jgi:hypothetical protein